MYSVVELEGKRVLTMAQLAESFAMDLKTLQRSFQRNKEHFQAGIHFVELTGEALKEFKKARQDVKNFKYAASLLLWLEEGVFMLAKLVKNEKAWQAYNMLVKQYFAVAQGQAQQSLLPYDAKRVAELEHRVQQIEKQLALVTLHSGEQKRLQKAVSERVHEICEAKARRPAYFAAIYRAIKNRYHVDSYRDVPQCQLQDALQFVSQFEGGAHI